MNKISEETCDMLEHCFTPRLDLEKVKTVEDCAIILDFLIRHTCPPIDSRLTYNGLDLIKDYLKD